MALSYPRLTRAEEKWTVNFVYIANVSAYPSITYSSSFKINMFCFRRFAPIWSVVIVVTLLFFITRIKPQHHYPQLQQEEAVYYRSVDTLFTSEKEALMEWTRSSKQPELEWEPAEEPTVG